MTGYNSSPTLANAVVTNTQGIMFIASGASAGQATITNVALPPRFYANLNIASSDTAIATAGSATIVNQGATATTANGATLFTGPSTAGDAVITNNGGDGAGKLGGSVGFGFLNSETPTAANAVLIANGGTNGGGGGLINFGQNSLGGAAHCELLGNGSLDLSQHFAPGPNDRILGRGWPGLSGLA